MRTKDNTTVEFGDFQTPKALADQVVQVLAQRGISPASIIEPTCGTGTFLNASLEKFSMASRAIGIEINPEYFRVASNLITKLRRNVIIDMKQADFFHYDWENVFRDLAEPILVVGNPPWVTASQLGALRSKNLPLKSNFQNHRGLDAITGKANFDIAESMLICLIEWMSSRQGTVAMLLKQSVARKVLFYSWKQDSPIVNASIYRFDAKKHFGVSVDACLLVCDINSGSASMECKVYDLASPKHVGHTIGYHQGMLLADIEVFKRHDSLLQLMPQSESPYTWRSGVKHDCAKVMELTISDNGLSNGLGENVDIEDAYVYPMLKGSGVANGKKSQTNRYMLVTQHKTGEPTNHITKDAPRTWSYLEQHGQSLDKRGSSIYKRRPRFSVFGVGQYTFTPWKVSICGLYKKLQFRVVGPRNGKPVVFDDTVYFVPCKSKREAELIHQCLDSSIAQEFLRAFIFWDSKRPITAEVLRRLDLVELVDELGYMEELLRLRPDFSGYTRTGKIAGRLF